MSWIGFTGKLEGNSSVELSESPRVFTHILVFASLTSVSPAALAEALWAGWPSYLIAMVVAFWLPWLCLFMCGALWVVWAITAPKPHSEERDQF